MRICLLRKLADRLDGIDVSDYREGDLIDLPRAEAELLIAEGWASPSHVRRDEVRAMSLLTVRTVAADQGQGRVAEQLRRVRDAINTTHREGQDRWRAEDHMREELRHSRSIVVDEST